MLHCTGCPERGVVMDLSSQTACKRIADDVWQLEMTIQLHLGTIEAAREAARSFFETDPELADPGNRLLARRVAQFWDEKGELS